MPKPNRELTSEQERAIRARDVSVALSAGAGCGKTFVLTERFLSHLNEDDDGQLHDEQLHRLIAITFTDRAAREMRERIRSECYRQLDRAPPEEADRWLGLIRSLDSARISTIHAFCAALLRSHAVEAGLDPRFAVIEQSQADTLLAEITEDTLRGFLSDTAAPLRQPLLDLLTQFSLERLPSLIAGLLNAGRSIDFKRWVAYLPCEITGLWEQFCRDTVVPRVLSELSASPDSRELLEVIRQLGSVGGELGRRCAALSQLIPELSTSRQAGLDLASIIECAKVQGAGSKKSWPDETLYERFKSAAERLRKMAKRAQTFVEFDAKSVEADAAAGLALLRVAHQVFDRYQTRKQELAWVDFNDLLSITHRLLTDPAHAELQERLAAHTRLLLVDECQDTDPLQVEIIKALGGDRQQSGKLFYVGDFKQSIYRFRGADPQVFRRLQQETPSAGRLPLSMNFRSQPAILHFMNALFCQALSSDDDPTLAYQPLRPQREQITDTPAVEFLWAVSNQQKSQAGAKDAARQQEADFIARRIRVMLDGQELHVGQRQADGGWSPRAVGPRDIAILFRALSDVQYYEERLRHYGIDYYLVGGHAFYAQQEIYDIVNLLRALASPADLISLAGALRSPLFSLTDESLFWLAQHPQGLAGGLHSENPPRPVSDEQRSRIAFAARTLRHLQSTKDRISITGLLNEAIALTGYDATLLAEFMGQRKLANLRKLLDHARAFDQSGVLSLADFIVQLSQFVVEQPREPLAATNPEGTDVVRLMTIHQSKGLEFPVVFVADLGREMKQGDRTAVWSADLGPLVKVPKRDDSAAVTGIDLHQAMNVAEDLAERLRLFYVATTRAADYLVLSGGLFHQDFESPSTAWLKLLAARFDLQTGRYIAELPQGEGFQTPVVRVTSSAPSVGEFAGGTSSKCDLSQAIESVQFMAREPSKSSAHPELQQELFHPVPIDLTAQRRFSVSRLKGELEIVPSDAAASAPSVDGGSSPAAAADLGTFAHEILARVEFDKTAPIEEIVKHLIATRGNAADDYVDAAQQMVAQFLQSDRAREITSAKSVYRELEFLLAWPPADRIGGNPGIGLYLQGFIDCLYQDQHNDWHVIDYKTNQVSPKSLPPVAAGYEMQLGVYALAVEQILRKHPIELALHFLRPSFEHSFVWDDAARHRTIETVNQAIDKIVHPATSRAILNPEP